MSQFSVILVQSGPTFNVSTLTTLLASLDVRKLRSVLVTLKNPDNTNPVSVFVDPSTDGVVFNTTKRQVGLANPLEPGHVEIQPSNLYPFIRVFAQTDSPFPVVNGVTFEVRGEAESSGALEWLLANVAGAKAAG